MENSELIQYLDEKFSKVNEDFAKSDQKFTNFSKELISIKEDVVSIKENMAIKGDFANLQTSVDGYAKKVDDYSQDETMLSHKVNRHENWLIKIADKIGIKLEY